MSAVQNHNCANFPAAPRKETGTSLRRLALVIWWPNGRNRVTASLSRDCLVGLMLNQFPQSYQMPIKQFNYNTLLTKYIENNKCRAPRLKPGSVTLRLLLRISLKKQLRIQSKVINSGSDC